MKLESKIGSIQKSQSSIYQFLSKINNLENLIPADTIKNWQATEDQCSFSVNMAGDMEVEIANREPEKTLKFKGTSKNQPIQFFFWVQLKEIATDDTRVKLTLQAELPIMLAPMAKKPLQNALNTLVDRLPDLLKNV